MKEDVNDEVFNGIPKNVIPFDGVIYLDGVLKLGGKTKGNHATHLWGWIERSIAQNLVWKCSYVDVIIKKEPMMWVSSAMDGNKQKGKWLVVKHKTLKWANVNRTSTERSSWQVPMVKRMIITLPPSWLQWL